MAAMVKNTMSAAFFMRLLLLKLIFHSLIRSGGEEVTRTTAGQSKWATFTLPWPELADRLAAEESGEIDTRS
jgi:hypothetical protein